MEEARRQRKKTYSASFFRSRTVFFGCLLFFASQLMQFVQLLEDAGARKAAGQAPPEDFTVIGIVWRVLMLGLLLACCILLSRHQNGKLRMGKTRLYLLCGALLILWAAIRFVDTVLEIFVYPEFILILDCLALGTCVIAPIVMLLLADLNDVPPDDTLLLFLGVGGVGFTVISLIIIGVVLRASYTMWRLVPELMFRLGLILFSTATLFKAFKLRASYPLTTPVVPEQPLLPRKPKKRPRADEPFSLHLDGEDDAPPQPYPPRAPRPETDSLRAQRQAAPRNPRPQDGQGVWQTGRIIVRGGTGRIPTQDPGSVPAQRQTCPHCGKRMPLGFPNCPRCGRSM